MLTQRRGLKKSASLPGNKKNRKLTPALPVWKTYDLYLVLLHIFYDMQYLVTESTAQRIVLE